MGPSDLGGMLSFEGARSRAGEGSYLSRLPPESLTYEVVVSEYFLGLRGAGLMLSPLDLDEVRRWERRGLPVAVVCRGLRRGLEQAVQDHPPGSSPPRSVRAYRLAVEDEWRAYQAGRVGDAPPLPPEVDAARARLAAARALLDDVVRSDPGPRRDAYRTAAAFLVGVDPAASLTDVDRLLGDADAALVRCWLRSLTRRERSAVGRRCAAAAGVRPPWARRSEHRATLRAHLLDGAREAGLLCLRGSV